MRPVTEVTEGSEGQVECFVPQTMRERHPQKKQGSRDTPVAEGTLALEVMGAAMETSLAAYRKLLTMGVAPELARLVLPQSMMTEFLETGSLGAYARIYHLRNAPDAQQEIRDYALAVGSICAREFPVAWNALVLAGAAGTNPNPNQ